MHYSDELKSHIDEWEEDERIPWAIAKTRNRKVKASADVLRKLVDNLDAIGKSARFRAESAFIHVHGYLGAHVSTARFADPVAAFYLLCALDLADDIPVLRSHVNRDSKELYTMSFLLKYDIRCNGGSHGRLVHLDVDAISKLIDNIIDKAPFIVEVLSSIPVSVWEEMLQLSYGTPYENWMPPASKWAQDVNIGILYQAYLSGVPSSDIFA